MATFTGEIILGIISTSKHDSENTANLQVQSAVCSLSMHAGCVGFHSDCAFTPTEDVLIFFESGSHFSP